MREAAVMGGTEPFGDQRLERCADDFGAAVPEYALRAFVEYRNLLPLIYGNNRVGGNGNNPRQFRFGKPQRVLCAFAVGDVFDLRDEVARQPCVITKNG